MKLALDCFLTEEGDGDCQGSLRGHVRSSATLRYNVTLLLLLTQLTSISNVIKLWFSKTVGQEKKITLRPV